MTLFFLKIYKVLNNWRNQFIGFLVVQSFTSKAVVYLGSEYGKKPIPKKINGIKYLISAGVGEDVSFDLELYNLNQLEIIFIDPTPRAFNHFFEVTSNLGQIKRIDYNLSGKQIVDSYDLTKVRLEHLHFINKALFDKDNENITLYAPANENFVSYSVSNNNNKNRIESKSINVKTITITSIVKEFNINEDQTILKLDIEGSESQVINSIFNDNFFPKILIVEIDELYEDFFRNYYFSRRLIKNIKKANYKFIGSVNAFDYCFERKFEI